jgi:hypothetical protein
MKKTFLYLSTFFVLQLLVTVLSDNKTGGVFGSFWNNILGQGRGGLFIIFLGITGFVYLIILLVKHLIMKNYFQNNKTSILVITGILLVFALFYFYSGNNKSKKNYNVNNNCTGNANCINRIRENFNSTNKVILNESYEGNGKFKITALDSKRGVTFNAFISTDCNCEITNTDISDVE